MEEIFMIKPHVGLFIVMQLFCFIISVKLYIDRLIKEDDKMFMDLFWGGITAGVLFFLIFELLIWIAYYFFYPIFTI